MPNFATDTKLYIEKGLKGTKFYADSEINLIKNQIPSHKNNVKKNTKTKKKIKKMIFR